MKRLAKAAIIVRLRNELDAHGSWCGETHVQKAAFILQEGTGVPLAFEFVLYRHGPFSFDLREELIALRAEGFLSLQPRSPYGPRLVSTGESDKLASMFPKTLKAHSVKIGRVAQFVGTRGVIGLERIATSLMLIRRDPDRDDREIGKELALIKPHIRYDSALAAVKEVRDFLSTA